MARLILRRSGIRSGYAGGWWYRWGEGIGLFANKKKDTYSISQQYMLKLSHRIPLYIWRKIYEAKEAVKGAYAQG